MSNKWMKNLMKMEGALLAPKDRFSKIVATDSPSVNFIYGRTHGLPLGYTTVLYGPPKGGKSVLAHMMAGWLHRTDPEAIVLKFDTEYRAEGQLDAASAKLFGIDMDRLGIIETNSPVGVFDQIEKDIAASCQAGAPVRMIIIDSVNGIQGRREVNLESVEKQTIGDHAQTIQIGLKRILPVIRKHDIALVLITQVRAEMDQTEIMRGNKFKMGASYGLQHFAEYFVAVEKNETKAGRTDIHNREFVNEGVTDLAGKGEITAIKIRAKMRDSSMGPKGRTGEFTFNFRTGVANQYEEVFKLGVARDIITKPNQLSYEFNGMSWKGKDNCIEAIRDSVELQNAIITELKARDLAGILPEIPEDSVTEPV